MSIIKPSLGTPLDIHSPFCKGLDVLWLFNEGGGDKAYDSSGNNHTGLLINNPSRVPGGINVDDTSSQYIVNETCPKITDGDDFTIVVLANVDNIATSTSCLIGSRDETGARGWSFKAEQYNNTGAVGFTFHGVGDYVSSINIPVGQNSFFAATRKGGSPTLTLYVNGYIENLNVGAMDTPWEGLSVGAAFLNDNPVDCLDGTIFSVYKYSRVLTATEIESLYINPYLMFYRGLRPYYQEVEEVGGNAPTGVFYGPLSGCLDGPI
jgi:hypothetical protein